MNISPNGERDLHFEEFDRLPMWESAGSFTAQKDMEIFGQKENWTGLKICGVTLRSDAELLVEMGVDAVGFNFWPQSKRYLAPTEGVWMRELAGKILRVGVFVNEETELPFRLFGEGMIDVVQLHGDESPQVVSRFREAGIPVVKAVGVKNAADVDTAADFDADVILLDAHAPVVYGGTGETFDWGLAQDFKKRFPEKVVVLAGGITAANAAEAVRMVAPAALDVASGAEVLPGVKDFKKVAALLEACGR